MEIYASLVVLIFPGAIIFMTFYRSNRTDSGLATESGRNRTWEERKLRMVTEAGLRS